MTMNAREFAEAAAAARSALESAQRHQAVVVANRPSSMFGTVKFSITETGSLQAESTYSKSILDPGDVSDLQQWLKEIFP